MVISLFFPVTQFQWKMEEMNAKGVILKAMEQFRLKSCIDFKPKDSEDYYISVEKLSGYVLSFCICRIFKVFQLTVHQSSEAFQRCVLGRKEKCLLNVRLQINSLILL